MRPVFNKSDWRRFRSPGAVWVARSAAILLVTFMAGCGGPDWQVATYPASGSVFINGKPAEGAVVELHAVGEQPDARNSRPWAIVQSDGNYSLSTYEKQDGAPSGSYAITLRWPPSANEPTLDDQLSGQYSTAAMSPWKVTIGEESNNLPPIELDNVKLKSPPKNGSSSGNPVMPGR